jgi:hypothetical protein
LLQKKAVLWLSMLVLSVGSITVTSTTVAEAQGQTERNEEGGFAKWGQLLGLLGLAGLGGLALQRSDKSSDDDQ